MWPAGTGFLIAPPAQPNVHQGVAVLSQSNRMLRTVQGAPPTDRAVRESTRYFTVLRPPSRSTLNCSWEGKGERACTQGFVVASGPQQRPTSKQQSRRARMGVCGAVAAVSRVCLGFSTYSESLACSLPVRTLRSGPAHGAQVPMAATRAGQ